MISDISFEAVGTVAQAIATVLLFLLAGLGAFMVIRYIHSWQKDVSRGAAKLLETEDALRASQERFELAVAGSSNGLWDWDINTNHVYYAPRFKELLGFSDSEMENTLDAWKSRLHPDDVEPTMAAVEAHIKNRKAYRVRFRLKCKSGEYRWFHARGQAVWNDEGRATRMAGSIMDISEQIDAEQELENSRRLYLSLVENLPVFLIRKDLEGHFTFANQAFCSLLGKTLKEVQGTTDFDHYPHELAEKYRRDDQYVVQSGTLFEDVEDHVDADEHRYFEVLKTQVTDGAGAVIGTQAICWDVTDRKKAEIALKEAKIAAEKANQAKSEFLANMSHEIRTPMNAIIGMTELVLESPLATDQREYLLSVMEAGESLLAIINEILDFSKIEAGKLQLETVRFDLREVLGSALKSLGVRAHKKGLELIWQCTDQVPMFVLGDPTRLRQIVFNLVGNAIKFTETGEILVSVSLNKQDDNSVFLDFSVADSGIGIASEDQKKIFDAFEQADASTTRQYGGTGLGLAISQRLVQLMQGELTVDSEVGKGSEFKFTIQLGESEGPSIESVLDTSKFQNTPVLVVDDNATNRRILVDVMTAWGLSVNAVESGEAALAYFSKLLIGTEQAELPLLVTDYQMPKMDGAMLVSQIRRDDRLADVKIIMLSSSVGLAQSECTTLNISEFLYKPIKQSELFEALTKTIGANTFLPIVSKPESVAMPPLNILLAEDGLANQKLAVGLLKRWGHQVTIAENGLQAVQNWAKGGFDVILMDVQMPTMDGLQACQEIRCKEAGTGDRIPIIAVTAHAMSGDRDKCMNAGMDAYVTKPFRKQALYDALIPLISKKNACESADNP
jgi:two-component system, sensor histidine kinase and response regulator